LLLSTSLLLLAGVVSWTPSAASGWNQGSAEAVLWQLLNGARTNNGLAPLQQHATLVSLARWRSRDMIERNYFDHTIKGTSCLVYCYYDSNGLVYDWAGENIAWNSGQTDDYSPVRAHEQFMGSSTHRGLILYGPYTHGGVGAYGADNVEFLGYTHNPRMYTELFMQAPAPAPPPPAPPPPPSGGGGTAPAPPAPAPEPGAPTQPAATPEPEPAKVRMDAPARPRSSAALDGFAQVRRGRPAAAEATTWLALEDVLDPTPVAGGVETEPVTSELRVEAAPASDPGLFGGIIGFFASIFG
jgi:uncharacterized protein YkwD